VGLDFGNNKAGFKSTCEMELKPAFGMIICVFCSLGMKKAPKSGLKKSKPTFKLDLKAGLEGGCGDRI
jgi:hypothetical protein